MFDFYCQTPTSGEGLGQIRSGNKHYAYNGTLTNKCYMRYQQYLAQRSLNNEYIINVSGFLWEVKYCQKPGIVEKFNFMNRKASIHHIQMHFIQVYKVEQTIQNRCFDENMSAVHQYYSFKRSQTLRKIPITHRIILSSPTNYGLHARLKKR